MALGMVRCECSTGTSLTEPFSARAIEEFEVPKSMPQERFIIIYQLQIISRLIAAK
jgi:hypothetical protein